jgi:NADH:ubiquinone oxidoreductase subunit 5 (subunit L)/multisubunit Na+/H+ antiporter MnhA subunit
MIFCTSLFTICYGFKLFFLIFLTEYRGFKSVLCYSADPKQCMSFSIISLTLLTVVSGYILEDIFIGFGNYIWLGTFPVTSSYIDSFFFVETYDFLKKNLIFLFSCFLFALFFFLEL